jgi:hypothetical protein
LNCNQAKDCAAINKTTAIRIDLMCICPVTSKMFVLKPLFKWVCF